MEEILNSIPQRPPFLFVDKILSREGNTITTEKKLTGEEEFFKGHFPNNPIMPGVLLCEACFQTGAILMGGENGKGLGVVTRIRDTKFKNFAKPGDLLTITVELEDRLENAFFMNGKITVEGKTIMSVKFQGALV